ncbi:MAG: hypothetical protein WD424_08635 [Paenibacillaceae bacterium]
MTGLIQWNVETIQSKGEVVIVKLWARFIVVAVLSVCIAWLLSFLPELKSHLPIDLNELQVFQNDNPVTLTEENIVDWIITVPLQLELRRVDWSDRILSVDFEVGTPMEPSKVIMNQLLDFVYYGLGATTNVDRVWARIVQTPVGEGQQPRRLLLALDAHRAQIFEEDYELWKSEQISVEDLIERRFQLTVTPQWTRLQLE